MGGVPAPIHARINFVVCMRVLAWLALRLFATSATHRIDKERSARSTVMISVNESRD